MVEQRRSSANSSMQSLELDDDSETLRPRPRNPLIQRLPPPPRTTAAAVIMLILGTLFLVLGLVTYFGSLYSGDKGISFLALGSLMFIPGSYASFILFGAWMGWEGYRYELIPSYDD